MKDFRYKITPILWAAMALIFVACNKNDGGNEGNPENKLTIAGESYDIAKARVDPNASATSIAFELYTQSPLAASDDYKIVLSVPNDWGNNTGYKSFNALTPGWAVGISTGGATPLNYTVASGTPSNAPVTASGRMIFRIMGPGNKYEVKIPSLSFKIVDGANTKYINIVGYFNGEMTAYDSSTGLDL